MALSAPGRASPVDTYRGAQHDAAFWVINPNGKVPALVDTDGPEGSTATLFDSTAILLYLAEKNRTLHRNGAGSPPDSVLVDVCCNGSWSLLGTSLTFPACGTRRPGLCGPSIPS
ncbi:glutathione S-transferase N-terminal domain-containing protein [Komagataeibacter diospyri]|uniref:glutathione S-transferase N-terminal domain-containing protein n=1 Tax=Komagataeibacter diospyri TaxID=1932662 RepID=UPI00351DFE59